MSSQVILLVEDNQDDVDLTMRAFKKNNVLNDVVVKRDGVEALDWLFGTGAHAGRDTSAMPSVILLDLNLPLLSGLDVLKRIREDARCRTVPVVILTTSKEERDLIDGYRLGANSYIRKPVDFVKFSEAIRQIGCYWLMLNEAPPAPEKP